MTLLYTATLTHVIFILSLHDALPIWLGASYGFPLSLEGAAPSIFNVNFQGDLINLAQRNYIKAAKSDVDVTKAQNADRRNEDRKSTRLNSSHVEISYAVF